MLRLQLPDIKPSTREKLSTDKILPLPKHIQQEEINILIRERNYQLSSLQF